MADPTPERVREWAKPYRHIGEPAFVAVLADRSALARQVIALREIAEEALDGWDDLREDLAASVERPCDADPTIVSLRARLDALVEQHNNGGES